jgi:cytoskeleton protein RodZ
MTKVTHLSLDEDGLPSRRRIHLREISGDSETPLETVGQDLRAARLRRGDDLATVSRALKIRKDHLEAVEEDDLGALPGRTYAIGFVRSYATYLGLDTTATVERFKQEISGRHEEHASPAPVMHDDEGRRLPQGWRIVAGIVVVALIYGAWHLFSASPSQETVPPPPQVIPAPHVVVAAPKPAPAAPPPAADDQAATPSPAQDDAAGNPATPPATAQAAAPAQPGQAPPAPAASNGHVYGTGNKGVRVVLRARADTHVEVRGEDGTLYLNRNLKAGDSYNVPNIPGMMMTSSDAGAVELDLDGLAMGRAGMNQQSGDTELDPQAIVDRFGTH